MSSSARTDEGTTSASASSAAGPAVESATSGVSFSSSGARTGPSEASVLRRRRDDEDKWPIDEPDDDEVKVDPQTGLRRGKRIIKTVAAAVLLFTVGSIMLWLGVKNLPVDKDRAIGMLVVGSLAFLPGSYATFILIGAWCRWDGYRYSDLPSYDD